MTRITLRILGGISIRVTSLWLVFFLSTSIPPIVAQEQTSLLTLEAAIATALENSIALKASHASVDLKEARLQNTRSGLFPKVDARFVYPFIGTESGVSLSHQRIWDFKQTQHLMKAGQAQIQSAALETAIQREEIILNTKVAYYTVLAQQALVAAAAKMVQESAKRLEQAENFAQLGRILQIDVAKAKINFGNAQLHLITTQNDVAKARLQLASSMGLDGDVPYELAPVLAYKPVEIDLKTAIQQALEVRRDPEPHGQETATKADLSASQQAQYPVIFGRTEYRIKSEGAEQPAFIVGVGVRYTLFDGSASVSKINEAKAQSSPLQNRRGFDETTNRLEVRLGALNVQLAEERMHIIAASLKRCGRRTCRGTEISFGARCGH
jgi:outer membrane protein TolC